MLTRIYGTAWATQEDLDAHLLRLEEAEKRDHRRLGRELDLFSSPDELGPGLWIWHPRGGIFRKELEDWVRDLHLERGYDLVVTPAHRPVRALGDERPPREVPGEHVSADGGGHRRLLRQADELPVPRARLQVAGSELPRPADALVGARRRSTATRRRARSMGSSGSEGAPRTTRTSSAPPIS